MPPALGNLVPIAPVASTGGTFEWPIGRGILVLYFYPKDNTPGCTTESAAFRDAHTEFQAAGVTIVGVSRDRLSSHERFKDKLQLPFELISDVDEIVCTQFGVIQQKSMYGKAVRGIERSTFVIGANGALVHAWRGVKVPGHVDEVLAFVRSL